MGKRKFLPFMTAVLLAAVACNLPGLTRQSENRTPIVTVAGRPSIGVDTQAEILTQAASKPGELSISPTLTGRPAFTDTPSITPTSTRTRTPTFTSTRTKTDTATATSTVTPTITRTSTFTITRTATPTPLPIFQATGRTTLGSGVSSNAGTECPGGSILVGGGFSTNTNVIVTASYKLDSRDIWVVYGSNYSDSSQELNVYAYCLSGTSGSIVEKSAETTVAATKEGHIAVFCPLGSFITGGGFTTYNDNQPMMYSYPDENGWQAGAQNNSAADNRLVVYAICLSGIKGKFGITSASFPIPAGKVGGGRANCPADSFSTGGGFRLDFDLRIYLASQLSKSDWEDYAINRGNRNRVLMVFAMCLSIP